MKSIDSINFRMCKYKMDRIQLTIPGLPKPYQVNTLAIGDIVIEKDFDGYQYPYFRVTIGVPNKVRRLMRKSHTQITAYVRMVYAYFKTQDTIGLPDMHTQEYTYLSENFYVFMEDHSPDVTMDVEEQIEKETLPDGIVTGFDNLTTIEILLYKKSDLNLVKQTPTKVYRNVTLLDSLVDYMNTVGMSKVLMTPPNNNLKRYRQFPYPPIRVDEQILRVCGDYGIHKCGTTLFFDFDKTYLIEKINKCTAWVPNEYKTIYVVEPTAAAQVSTIIQGCSYESDHCGYCTMTSATSSADSMEREQVFGSRMDVIDKKTGDYVDVSANTTTISGGGKKSRTITSYDGDASTAYAMRQRMIEESNVLTAVLDGTDLTMLAPNKLYQLVFLSSNLSKHNGPYRLKKFTCAFHENDREWFTPTVLATFVGDKIK